MRAKGRPRHISPPSVLLIVLAMCSVDAGAADSAPAAHGDDSGIEFFERAVRPLLIEHCYECHSDHVPAPKGGLRLDSRDGVLKGGSSGNPAIVAGNAAASPLIAAVRHADSRRRMPPKKKLRDDEIAALETWVAMGAPDPRTTASKSAARRDAAAEFWSFRRPIEPVAPAARADAGWARTPVDAFIYDALGQRSLKPSPEADRRTLIRRATFDLTGLPPTPEEVEQFLTDPSADAYDRLIERLLASPRYGERWGRYWLDLARYSDTKGYVYRGEERRFVHAHNYRDWVIRALNEDMPYDRFLLLQIAGDQLAPGDGARVPQDLAAMGFLTVGRRFLGVVPDIIDDRMDVVMRSTMGLTVGCARCHDHKFDPIPAKDYYSLYGVFAGSTEKTVSLDPAPPPSAQYRAYEAGYQERVKKLEDTVRAKTEELVARLRVKAGEYLAAAPGATRLPDDVFTMILGPDDLNPAVVRQWRQYLDRRSAAFDPLWAPWTALIAVSEAEFAAKAPAIVRSVLTDPARPLNRHVARAFEGATITSMNDVARIYGRVLAEANTAWLASVATHPAGLPDADQEALRLVLYGPDSPSRVESGSVKDIEWYFDEPTRVQFGTLQAEVDRWILTAPGAPPHSVVLVDRPEQANPRVFKRGNPSTRGEEVTRHFLTLIAGDNAPTFQHGSGRLEMARAIASSDNPLTSRVMVNRIWTHHFGIGLVATPSDFGTRSEPPSHPALLDWLAVQFVKQGWSVKAMHRLIMRSAAYRQASVDRADALAVDPENRLLWRMNRSRLDFESMRDALLAASGELDLSAAGGPAGDVSGNRRTIYASIDRQFVPDVFRVFDFANPDLHIPQRGTTTVPQQALFFMNAPFASARARALAARQDVRAATSDAERVRMLYRIVYQRAPSADQVSQAVSFVAAIAAAEPDRAVPAQPGIAAWKYGYGSHDASSDRVIGFTPLPHFQVNAWQGGTAWPDATLGWVQLTATGGHAGNDLAHAAIRRWVAPRDLTVRIEGDLRHGYVQGNGVNARIVSSRAGTVGHWTVHNSNAATASPPLELKRGDTLDFVVDHAGDLGYDMFTWAPVITVVGGAPASDLARWSAADDFTGDADATRPPPLGPWEMYAHVLLSSNEFVFVD